MKALDRALTFVPDDPFAPPAPKVRADCVNGPRPCPWVRCRYHLLVERLPGLLDGRCKIDPRIAADILEAMKHSCALDLADKGGLRLEDIGALFDMTRQRAQQIVVAAALKAKNRAKLLGIPLELPDPETWHPAAWDLFPPAPDDVDIEVIVHRREQRKKWNVAYKRRNPDKVREWTARGKERAMKARRAS